MQTVNPATAPVPQWFKTIDHVLRLTIMALSGTLFMLMVLFTVYTIVMRYVFEDPPFWGDTVSLFCNLGLVFMSYALAVRDREEISSEALHTLLPDTGVTVLVYAWQAMTVLFGGFLAWFGVEAALMVPGHYWELGGLPKMVPMLALPLCGVLTMVAGVFSLAEQVLGWSEELPTEPVLGPEILPVSQPLVADVL